MKVKRDVAKDLGVEVEKVQELIDGRRHIGGETMDKVLQSIDNAKENQTAKNLEIMDWYNNTDLKELRKEFGYGQSELAKKLNVNYSTLNSLEGKYQHLINVTPLMQTLYDFYKDDFNKKISTTKKVKVFVSKNEILNSEVYKWWKNTDLKALRKSKYYGQQELADILNVNVKTLDATESKIHNYVSVTPVMQKLYDFYHKDNEITQELKVVEPVAQVVTYVSETPKEVEKNDDIIIKIDKDGNITYLDGGNTIANITEIHLDKVGNEKPSLEITLKRIF